MSAPGHLPDVVAYPQSRAGKIAVGLIATALGASGLVAAMLLFAGGLVEDETFIHAEWLDIPLIALAVCGVSAGIAALEAFVVEHERSVFVALALVVGLVIAYSAIYGM
jgi:hypothetical protein